MKTHTFDLNAKYFDLIKAGEKTYEIRLNDKKRKLLNVGDTLIFKRNPKRQETITTEVTGLYYFKSFKELADNLPIDKIGFSKREDFLNVIRGFYTKEDEEYLGVVAIKLHISTE